MTRVEQAPPPLISSKWIAVGDGHSLHLAEYGNPNGVPLLYLHGGPGAGCSSDDALLFDGRHWRILLLDQRGAGLSRPRGGLEHNGLTQLLADMEVVRETLGIENWCLAGGSFGATLGLIYSGRHPDRVIAQSYWGLFIPSSEGMAWLYGPAGAARLFPDEYNSFSAGIPVKGWLSLLFEYFSKGFVHANQAVSERAFRRWLDWELALAYPGNHLLGPIDWRSRVLALIELHYARSGYFDAETAFVAALPDIRAHTRILQGECDWVCPAEIARHYGPLEARLGRDFELVTVVGGYHSLADGRMHKAVCAAANWMLSVWHQHC
ncbi:alpha/beta fold hydrolase [Shewanella amazonensis]|uniref:alpha/beta fold hydrolase n=1 Tax=Shewanella amazonensis TaxID=60478 RepID=UPI0002E0BF3C|nr:alpha/beta fold hydrolase [Shewanella amazonensis]